MHDSHQRETEYYDGAIRNLVQSKWLFDAKKSPEAIEYLHDKQNN